MINARNISQAPKPPRSVMRLAVICAFVSMKSAPGFVETAVRQSFSGLCSPVVMKGYVVRYDVMKELSSSTEYWPQSRRRQPATVEQAELVTWEYCFTIWKRGIQISILKRRRHASLVWFENIENTQAFHLASSHLAYSSRRLIWTHLVVMIAQTPAHAKGRVQPSCIDVSVTITSIEEFYYLPRKRRFC